jgi:hypothetical protein
MNDLSGVVTAQPEVPNTITPVEIMPPVPGDRSTSPGGQPESRLGALRTAMRGAIEQRSVPEIEDIFAQANNILAKVRGSEARYKQEKNFKGQCASWKVALCLELLRAQWLVETKEKKLRYVKPKDTKFGARTGVVMLDAPKQPPRIGIDRKKSQQLQALARLSPQQFKTVLADKTMPTLARIIKLYATPKRGSRRVRGPMELHPITGDYDDLTSDELTALSESLRAHGLVVPVVVWRNQIVDGRHRAKLCQELGIELRTNDISKQCSTEAEMIARVRALNEHRRANTKSLTTAEKQARIEAALKANPERSDRRIAKEVGASPTTAGKVRGDLEAKGDVSKMDTRTDARGRKQPGRKPKSAAPNKKRPSPPGIDEPSDVAQPDLPLKPAPEPVIQELVFEGDVLQAPSLAPKAEAAPPVASTDRRRVDPDGLCGTIIGLAMIRDVDFGPVAAAMPIERLLDARDECENAALTIEKWSGALNKAIESAAVDERVRAPLSGERTKCVPTTSS